MTLLPVPFRQRVVERCDDRAARADADAYELNNNALFDLFTSRGGKAIEYESYLDDVNIKRKKLVQKDVAAAALTTRRHVPAFSLQTLDGKEVTSADFLGSITVYWFWGEWCAACQAAMPRFSSIAARYETSADVKVTTINTDVDSKSVELYMNENGYEFTVLLGRDYFIKSGMLSIPRMWIVDGSGAIRYELAGFKASSLDYVVACIEALKLEKAIAAADSALRAL